MFNGIPPRVLVVGWGFLGAAIGNRLFDDGMDVLGLTRSESTRTCAARARGIDVSIADASDHYGNPERIPARESDPLRPVSAYGASCLAAEVYTEMYGRTYGLSVQIVRCANAYGPGQPFNRNQGAVAVFLHRISVGLPLRIVGDGTAVRDYVHVDDVAFAISQIILEKQNVGVVNLGSGHGHSVLELVELVSDVVGCRPALEFLTTRRHDVDSIILDISKLASFISYAPIELSEGLRLTWQRALAPALAPGGAGPKLIRLRDDDQPPVVEAALS